MSKFVAIKEGEEIEFDRKPSFKEYANTVLGINSVRAEDVKVILKQLNGEEVSNERIAKAKLLKEIV